MAISAQIVHVGRPTECTPLPITLHEQQGLDVLARGTDRRCKHRLTGAEPHAALDLVRHVRDDLHRGTEVIAATLLGDHAAVDAAGREVAVAASDGADESLVVAKVEVGLGAIRGDEHLAVLKRTHRTGIDVEVRVQLDHADLETARFEYGAEGGRRNALA